MSRDADLQAKGETGTRSEGCGPGSLLPRSQLRSGLSGVTPRPSVSCHLSRRLSVSALVHLRLLVTRAQRGAGRQSLLDSHVKSRLLAALPTESVGGLQGRPELVRPLPCLAPSARIPCHVSAETCLVNQPVLHLLMGKARTGHGKSFQPSRPQVFPVTWEERDKDTLQRTARAQLPQQSGPAGPRSLTPGGSGSGRTTQPAAWKQWPLCSLEPDEHGKLAASVQEDVAIRLHEAATSL